MLDQRLPFGVGAEPDGASVSAALKSTEVGISPFDVRLFGGR